MPAFGEWPLLKGNDDKNKEKDKKMYYDFHVVQKRTKYLKVKTLLLKLRGRILSGLEMFQSAVAQKSKTGLNVQAVPFQFGHNMEVFCCHIPTTQPELAKRVQLAGFVCDCCGKRHGTQRQIL